MSETSENQGISEKNPKPQEEIVPEKEVEGDKAKAGALEESNESISKVEADIIRQVEYYFSDSNLLRDKFLLDQISKDEEGWVPFSVLLTFKRLAALSTDPGVIADALHKSDEGLIEVSEDRMKIRRHPERPIPEHNEERRKEIASRTAYAKGFPLDIEMSDLIEYFNPFEKVVNIYMRKYLDRPSKTYKFKGSVFVTFAKKEQCEDFINKDKVEYKGKDLIRKWQEKYLEEKRAEHNSRKKSKAEKKSIEVEIDLPKGTVLHFDGSDENTTREHIREALEKFGAEIAYIEYNKGDKNGYIRLQKENSAQSLLEKLEDNKLKLNDSLELTLRTLTEEEEKEFLKKAADHMKSRRNNQNKNRGNRKRKAAGESEGETPTKQK